MKCFKPVFTICFFTIVIGSTELVADWNELRRATRPEGLSAYASLNLLSVSQKNTNQEKTISSYDDRSTTNQGMLIPDLEVQYSTSDWLTFLNFDNAGVDLTTGVGKFLLTYNVHKLFQEDDSQSGPADQKNQSTGYLFENPFLLNEKRKVTTISSGGYKLKYAIGNELGFGITFSESWVEYEKDRTESLYSNLGRSGKQQDLGVALSIQIASIFFQTVKVNAKGKADSADGHSGGGDLFIPLESIDVYLGLTYAFNKMTFRERHPVFQKTRKEETTILSYFFSYDITKTWDAYLFYYQEQTESNIDFFDSVAHYVTLGTGYLF